MADDGLDNGPQSGAGETGTQSGPGTDPGTGGTPPAPPPQSGGTETGATTGSTVTQAEYDALRARMQAADKRAADSEKALKDIQDKDKPEIERLKAKSEADEKEKAELAAALRAERINRAFLADNTHTWHNPTRALALADLTGVDIDSDGKVTGLKKVLDALATSDPWLLKPKEGDGEGDGEPGAPAGPPSTAPANNGQQGKTGYDRKTLAKKFSALNTRQPAG